MGSLAPIVVGAQCTSWSSFESPVRYASSADQKLLVRDLDGDGAPEIIVSGNHVDELNAFSLLPNRGDGNFGSERLVPTGFGEELEDAGDLNGDGITDIVASDYWSNGIVIYRGLGDFRFAAGVPYGTATHGGPSLVVDYDHDGVLDVVSFSFGSGNPVRVHFFRGIGDGTLAPKVTFETGLANATSPSLRVLNGTLEILAGERSGNLGLIRYTGGAIAVTKLVAGPGFDLSSTFGDVNGDGIADIIDTDDNSAEAESIFVTLANADGTFRERKQLVQRRHVAFPTEVRVADFDWDGNPDLIVSDFQSPKLYLFRGDGTGAFAEGVAVDAGAPANAFAVADVNRDGRPDIITANSDHTVSVLLNRGACRGARRRSVRH